MSSASVHTTLANDFHFNDQPKTFQNENNRSVASEQQDNISSLLSALVEQQQFLKTEIAQELKNSHLEIRKEIQSDLREITDKVNQEVNSIARNLKSLSTISSSAECSPLVHKSETVSVEAAEIARVYSLATRLMEGQSVLRQEVFCQLRLENEEVLEEVKGMVRRVEGEVKQKLDSVRAEVVSVRSFLGNTLNGFRGLSDQIEDLLSNVDGKVQRMEKRIENALNSSSVLLTTLEEKKLDEPLTHSLEEFALSPYSSCKTDQISLVDSWDTSSVCSHKTDMSTTMLELKEMVSRQNKKLLSSPPQVTKISCKPECICYQQPIKIDDSVTSSWNTAQKPVEYDEKLFWSTIETYSLSFVASDPLAMFVRTLVIYSVTKQPKMRFYNLTTFCAFQLRDPSNTSSLALANVASNNEMCETLPEPVIDWETILDESDDIFATLSNEEQMLIEKVMALPPETIVLWGTAYACLLLRLHDKGATYVLNKLNTLNQELASTYDVDVETLPVIPQCDIFLSRLKTYSDYDLESWSKNTLYKGMIEKYESAETGPATKRILNFLLLKSIRYQGMPLLTLVDEVVKLYAVELTELLQSTAFCRTLDSWKMFYSFVFSSTFNNTRKWKYCVCFDQKVLPELGFSANHYLCSLLCSLIDANNMEHNRSKILYQRIIKKQKPEWALNESDLKYLKTALRLLRRLAKSEDARF